MTLSSLMNAAMTEQMRHLLVDQPIHIPRPHIPTTAEGQARAFIYELTGVSPQQQIEMEKIQEGADRLYLKHTATDLATGTDTAPQIVDEFKKTMNNKDSDDFTKRLKLKTTELLPAQIDTYTKICNDQRPQKPMSWSSSLQNEYSKIKDGHPIEQPPGAGEREIYRNNLKDLEIQVYRDKYSELQKGREKPVSDRIVRQAVARYLGKPKIQSKADLEKAELEKLTAPTMAKVQEQDAMEGLTSPYKSKSDAAFERLATRFRMDPDIDPNPAILGLLVAREDANITGKQVGSFIGKKQFT